MALNLRKPNIGALVLIGLGGLFLFLQMTGVNGWSLLGDMWAVWIAAVGAAFLIPAYFGGKRTAGLAFPGAIIMGTALILGVQSATGQWQSWAYAWTLYPVFVGWGLAFVGQRMGDNKAIASGRAMMRMGGIAFLVGAAFFELLIFGAGFGILSTVLPVLLIGAGAWMLFMNKKGEKAKNTLPDKPKFQGAALVNGVYTDDFAPRKRKNTETRSATRNGVRYEDNRAQIDPRLQRDIDAALSEE